MDSPSPSPLRQRFDQRRAEAIESYRKHLRPDILLAALRRIADQAVRDTLKQHPLPEGAALAAVGGYGRGELYPYSDIDVLILLGNEPGADDKTRIEKLIAALWNLGLDLGHSVRSIADCRREAAHDITIETALMELRWIAGSKPLVRQLAQTMQRRQDAQTFFQAKRAEMVQRHARHQDTPYALEPNCKEAPGGLRDLLTLRWIAQAAGVGNTWKEIAASGMLTPAEHRALRRAELAFKRLRIELHLLAGRREDRVLFDLQPALAATYGFEATKTRRPSELLMQRYYWAARVVSQLTTILMQAFEERLFPVPASSHKVLDDDFCQVHNRLDVRRADEFERKPTLLLRAFLVMQQNPELTGLSAQIMRAMWHSRKRIDAQFRANPVNRYTFMQILQQPRGIVHALRRMTMLNILPRYLPEFRRIVGQMQHDLFHAYTVDQHTLMVIRNLRRFTMPEHAQEYPLASQLIAELDRHWLLYVAALYHDIAKGRGGDHSELGARDARRFCANHQIGPEDSELVEFLVREHLTMSKFAQKRDLTDPGVIHEFARRVRDERHLTALYLLTVADIRGTSPKVWNAWKGKLLEDLYRLTLAALGGAQPDRGTVLALRREEASAEVRRLGLRDESRDQFWNQLDVAYFLRHEASEIAWHTRHLYYRVDSPEPVVKARVVGQNEGLQIMVYSPDRSDLFVDICGYLDQRALGVQEARIHTTRHGWALDSFIVLLPGNDRDFRSWANLVEHELAERLARPPEARRSTGGYGRRRSRRARVFPIVPNIELQPDESGTSWRLSLIAADRPGLLYSLAQVFARHGIDLNMAKILTLGDRVEDVFIVEGQVLGQPRSQLQFERSLLASLDEAG
ncbi:[protein-PII] uridylyltransferase [Pusillimonas noertemannii]|uniref:Bifunctional uridylyltransferase/uridylyl-removing enzyme n=1 Tax=Pusillimonas noertemannii TaxID=305977 RepID=A0A2U1CJQ5_9BURK|nr:[protein-PII] uridylyltransferase [Pusillimonas noertemannii]NYT69854.1 [protein-PII] uridylyltransferase [Pusillimonas noertemannii]PVY61222.1 UTP--GlnB (protein PII) uridylyltransferase GlnD [Pusillimonas noertemannii]TFL09153.1 [protein-PII] uridylyltransferase [Pusillimonas noertemannii]